MNKPKLPTYTTKITANQTIAEIYDLLSDYGVKAIMTEYDGRQVSAVSFKMEVEGKMFPFRMPCNWRGVYQILNTTEYPFMCRNEDQAIKVAWRILYTWIKAQLALVEVNIVKIETVFLPYTIMGDNRTLAEHVETDSNFLLK